MKRKKIMDYVIIRGGVVTLYYSHKEKEYIKSLRIYPDELNIPEKRTIMVSNQSKLSKIISDYIIIHTDKPPVDYVRTEMEREKVKKSKILLEVFDVFIEYKKEKVVSMKDYNNLKTGLIDYEYNKNVKLTLDSLTVDFFNKFQYFLSEPRKGIDKNGENYKNRSLSNTIRKRIVNFMEFMKWVNKNDLHHYPINLFLDIRTCMVPEHKFEDRYIEVLTIPELHKVYQLELTGMEEKIRDIWIFQSMSSLRYSDYFDLKPNMFDGNTLIKRTVKTGTQIQIPLNGICMEILHKYNFNLPKYTLQINWI